MFDYMLKILPNGRILVRNTALGESKTLKATQVSDYIQNVLEEHIKTQEELDQKVEGIKDEAQDLLKKEN